MSLSSEAPKLFPGFFLRLFLTLRRTTLRFSVLAILCGTGFANAYEVGFRQLTVGAGSERPLSVGWWYPSADNASLSLLGDTPIFIGQPVQREARALPGKYPLVLLSHGYAGSGINQSWLAHTLVQQGFVVAAPNHPGTAWGNLSTPQSPEFWRRTQDLSRVLDALLANPEHALIIDQERIAAAGHSLGGWTAMLAGGARFSPTQFQEDCLTNGQLAACKIYRFLRVGETIPSLAKLASNQRDARIKAVVSLDLGLARGFTAASLRAMPIPVLVIAASAFNPELSAELESAPMHRELPPNTPYLDIPDATHYSFLQACKPGAEVLFRSTPLDERDLCKDSGERARDAIHAQVTEAILLFLQRTLAIESTDK